MIKSAVFRSFRLAAICHLALALTPDASAQSVGSQAAAAGPPNVILILADDIGYGDVGFLGATDIMTPNIDQLANQGVILSAFYTAPSCSLSRTMLMTGSYAPRLSASRNYTPASRVGIHPDEITLGELFRSAGYATGIFGKWHLGDHYDFRPQRHGFDEYFGIPYSNDMWPFSPTNTPRPDEDPRTTAARERCELTGCAGFGSSTKPLGEEWPNLPLYDGEAIVEFNTSQSEFGGAFFTRALDFIERNAGRPFFAYLPLTAPHVPLHPSDPFRGASQRDLFGDTVEEMDFGVGRIMNKLAELGIDDNTLVFFLSDNGPWLQYGIDGGTTGPLRGGKETQFEGGIRVPAAVRWPGGLAAGGQVDEPLSLVDILPTLAGLAGYTVPTDRTVDGVDVWPVITGQSSSRSADTIFGFDEKFFGLVDLGIVRKGPWKLHVTTQNRTVSPVALYNIDDDLGETTDVKSAEPAVVSDLVALGEQVVADILDNQRPLGNVIRTGDPFAQRSGFGQMVVMEAENYHVQEERGGKSWQTVSLPHSSFDESLQILPDSGVLVDNDYENLSSHLIYRANFNSAGRYYVWVRARGTAPGSDSLHVGINGQAVESGRLIEGIFDYWWWTSQRRSGGRAYIDVASAGVHEFDVWMREDGVVIDKFILTTDANFEPSGQGLTQNRQVSVPVNQPPTASDDGPYTVDEGGLIAGTFNVLDNDTDPDTAVLNAVLVDPPARSALFELRPDGTFDYTHDGSESSADTFTYRADDGTSQSNLATVSLTINPVNDRPAINLVGPNVVNIVTGATWTDDGATASDAEDGDITASIVVGGDTVDTSTPGSYVITYDVTDSGGASATQVIRTVNVAANSAPVITLIGNATVNMYAGDQFNDPGATADDNEDGDLTASIVVGGDVVDNNTPGTYIITYNVTDLNGLAAEEVTRTVNVAPDLAPVITLNGDANVTLQLGDAYADAGATALDDRDGDLTASIIVGGDTVDTSTIGSYVITYNVADSSGNAAAEVTRTVTVRDSDQNAPVITLIGAATVRQGLWVDYTDPGATAMDVEDGNLTAAIVVGGDTVNTSRAGTYVITYNVTDSAGNAAAQVTRTVIVEVGPAPPPRRGGGGGSLGLVELLIALGALALGRAARRKRWFESHG
jgi:arylsulfatase A-like enzyme/proteasome assembly chaperone (PAC2) family protein